MVSVPGVVAAVEVASSPPPQADKTAARALAASAWTTKEQGVFTAESFTREKASVAVTPDLHAGVYAACVPEKAHPAGARRSRVGQQRIAQRHVQGAKRSKNARTAAQKAGSDEGLDMTN